MKKIFSIIYGIIVIVFALTSCVTNNNDKLSENVEPDISDITIEDVIVEDIIVEDIIVEDVIVEN